ncbi:MAG TPA: NAD(P)H-dependent oxidoreductase [Candidatus Limiplasma sp.]|nr:NAD(P)H-dependent oxidoreductase [Candidatus Limiplasma sp.]HPS80696.1 NAD(P)H-dependent oxidoreductase [Candidatus Limiplasma sp.]
MNAIVLYYSYNGHTKKVAEKFARSQGAELVEVQTQTRKSKFLTYLVDCPRAMMRKSSAIEPLTQDLSAYDLITLASPVWASYPTPAFNSMVKLLPKNKNVQVLMVSASGSGATKKSEHGTKALIKHQGCKVISYKDVKQPIKDVKQPE